MNIFLRSVPCFFLGMAVCRVQAQSNSDRLNVLREEWSAVNTSPAPRNYTPVIRKLVAYSREPGGKSWAVDYWLGSSYCHTAGSEKTGVVALQKVLKSKDVSPDGRKAAEKVLAVCGSSQPVATETDYEVISIAAQQSAGYSGKAGYSLLPGSDRISTLKLSTVTIEDLHKRLVDASMADLAMSSGIERGKPYVSQGTVVGNLLVLTNPRGRAEEVAACMTRARGPMEKQFGMVFPASFITVYSVAPESVPAIAASLHGVRMPLGTAAYSVYEDLSIVGVGNGTACGSLNHELMHLAIRSNFGDSPAWLEEGLASEIAVAGVTPDHFEFAESWRDIELRRDWALRPKVADLLDRNWSDFATSSPSEISRVAALHAMSAAFVRYLAARGQLVPIYFAIRDSLLSDHPKSDLEIVEGAMKMKADRIDVDFTNWFKPPSARTTHQ